MEIKTVELPLGQNKRTAEYGECANIKKFQIESNIIPGMFRFVCKQIKQHIKRTTKVLLF